MIRLVVNLNVPASNVGIFEDYYTNTYAPMLAQQRGFVAAALGRLYPGAVLDEIGAARPVYNYQLSIDFQTEADRRAWVSDPRHDPAWHRVVSLSEEAVHTGYDVVRATSATQSGVRTPPNHA